MRGRRLPASEKAAAGLRRLAAKIVLMAAQHGAGRYCNALHPGVPGREWKVTVRTGATKALLPDLDTAGLGAMRGQQEADDL